jgi:hypothetical protein
MILLLLFAWYWRDARDGWRRGSFEAAIRQGDRDACLKYASWLIEQLRRTGAFDVYAWQPRWERTG